VTEAQSPFLPGTKIQYAWSSIGLELIKTCARKYQYTIIDGWATRNDSIHLRFGIEYHTALQDYAVARAKDIPHDDAIHDTIRALHGRVHNWEPDRTSRAGKYKNRESIMALVIDYLDHFADDPADTFILDTGEPAVELSFRFELDWGPQATYSSFNSDAEGNKYAQPYLLCGHLDRVVNYLDDLYVMDRKTSISTIGSYYMDQWTPSNQMSLYSLAGKIMLNSPIKGVIIDAAQVLLDKPNAFARGFAYRSETQLTEWLEDLRHWLAQAEIYAANNYWPQNDTACTKYGGCVFKEVCSVAPQVRDSYLAAQFDKTDLNQAWNPFFDRSGA
jgi:PD-(D/E)XK nuclease superfamily